MKNKYNSIYFSQLNYHKSNLSFLNKNSFFLKKIKNFNDLKKNKFNFMSIKVIFCYQGFFYDRKNLSKFQKLKFLVSNTTSDKFIDHDYCKKNKIKILTLANKKKLLKNITPTAEHTIGLILSITRNYIKAIHSLNKNKWDRRPYVGEQMLSKSVVGIIGGGRIGKMVTRILLSFGSKVIVAERKNKNFKIKLRQICRESDIISLHIPSFKNENFFSKNQFKLIKKFYLINTSRGEVVNENYVLELLKKRLMLGYASDVLNNEFDASFKLSKNIIFKNRNKFNIILTPHIGGSTKDAWRITEKSIILELKEQISKTT